jgi:tRNA threonylcarbamoyladenosine biosynthesis protein TsaB
MKILALDCSTQACSVALLSGSCASDGDIIERHELAARSHTERLLPMVDDLLAQGQHSLRQLDAIAFGCGPGSFTGLRICLGVVQGLAFGAEVPVVPISSLAALAQTALVQRARVQTAAQRSVSGVIAQDDESHRLIFSTIDARMDEIYWGLYDIVGHLVVKRGVEQLSVPEDLSLPALSPQASILAVGTGLNYLERLACSGQLTVVDPELLPRASSIAQLACEEVINKNVCLPEQALPTYLRDQVAWKKQQ